MRAHDRLEERPTVLPAVQGLAHAFGMGHQTEHVARRPAVDAGGKDGLGTVYLNFMQQIDNTLHPLNRRLLFWGDIAQKSPELLKAMPESFKRDTIALAWEYNPSNTGSMSKPSRTT